jgi:ribonuclease D
MPEAIWIDTDEGMKALGLELESQPWVGVDTEFLRERTFFPRLCLLQLAAGGRIWCVDVLRVGGLDALVPVLTAAATRKVIHAARQDLETVYLTAKRVISPLFDTQIAAACVGMKPQVGYAELVRVMLDVNLPKGQTRTDWSKRPLSREQLEYAADDVAYLGDIAARLDAELARLGRRHWVGEDCAALQDPGLYEPDPAQAWERLRGLAQLAPRPRARAKTIAMWRERSARARDLPRSWIIPDAAIFEIAHADPPTPAGLRALAPASTLDEGAAVALFEELRAAADGGIVDNEPGQESRPTPEQRAVADRLAAIVDARAAELRVSAEVLAPRGELKALAMGRRDAHALRGWRREEIGTRLLEALG